MTDPTPTRAEGLTAIERLMLHVEHDMCPPDMDDLNEEVKALRGRAEAAEASLSHGSFFMECDIDALQDRAAKAEAALTAARRAEAAAWNDAIEAAAEAKGYEHLAERAAIRALRRAAPTEGEA